MNEKIVLCRHKNRGGCCPTLEHVKEDEYILKDDNGVKILLSKENIDILCDEWNTFRIVIE